MFRIFRNIKSSFFTHSQKNFTTIPILTTKFNLIYQNSSVTIKKFLKKKEKLSNLELITYLSYFSTTQINNSVVWDAMNSRVEQNFDQFSFNELALISSTFGKAKRNDEKFWRSLEFKLLENLFVDEDSYHFLTTYLQGFADRGFRISEGGAMSLLNYLESNLSNIPSNDLAALANVLFKLKISFTNLSEYEPLLRKISKKSILELKNLDCKGLANLALYLKRSGKMNEVVEKEIIKNLPLQAENMEGDAMNLIIEAFEGNKKAFEGTLGKVINSINYENLFLSEGKLFAEMCYETLKRNKDNQELNQKLKNKIQIELEKFDGSDSIKIAYCCKVLNFKEEYIIQYLRNAVFHYLDTIKEEETRIVREIFEDLIPNDKEFWNKCTGPCWKP